MVFDHLPIGIGEGLTQESRFWLARFRGWGGPSLKNALGAVEVLLVSSDRKYLNSPACLAELVPKLTVGLAPARERASGGRQDRCWRRWPGPALLVDTGIGSGSGSIPRSLQPALIDGASWPRASGSGETTPCAETGRLRIVRRIFPRNQVRYIWYGWEGGCSRDSKKSIFRPPESSYVPSGYFTSQICLSQDARSHNQSGLFVDQWLATGDRMLFVWRDPGTKTSDVEKLREVSLAHSGLHEKDLENLIAKRIEYLVRDDQLMVIMQERSRQEEPDILAINESGTLFIFELKRWEGRSENILQVLRYGQKFGRYEYERLNWYFQSYSRARQRATLKDAHKDFFELSECLEKSCFNKTQQFVVVTNGLDYDTWDAIAYWKTKGLKISPLIYRLYRLSGELYIDFDPYGPVPDAPKDQEGGLYVVNTNWTYDQDAYKEMVSERKGAAYYGRKHAIQNIRDKNFVCLYHVGVGVIGIGKATSDYLTKDIDSDVKAEYYIPIAFEYLVDITKENWTKDAVHAWEINQHFGTSYRFRQTVFQLPFKFAEFIRAKFKEKGVRSG